MRKLILFFCFILGIAMIDASCKKETSTISPTKKIIPVITVLPPKDSSILMKWVCTNQVKKFLYQTSGGFSKNIPFIPQLFIFNKDGSAIIENDNQNFFNGKCNYKLYDSLIILTNACFAVDYIFNRNFYYTETVRYEIRKSGDWITLINPLFAERVYTGDNCEEENKYYSLTGTYKLEN